tara:strand:+ start:27801 stop:27989 length:189 start_codon:yes stop_codon:yes gene_type:complete
MPTYERRFFILTLQNEMEGIKEQQESGSKTTSTGKGTRSTSMSGQATKAWAAKNQGNTETPL